MTAGEIPKMNEMGKTSRLLAIALGYSLLLVTGCASASGSSTHPARRHPNLVRTPWGPGPIFRGRNSRTLLLDTIQGYCSIHYTTGVLEQTSHVIRFELLEPDPEAQPFRCPAIAVRGSFFVPVHLKAPYRGQRLVDPVTGRAFRLTPRSGL